tara:strand:- start:59 stop:850 length:792 start_codon:yes stop_codon:yes gene_type:complete
MSVKEKYWVVTDIDGTLMDHAYDLSPALPTINLLRDLGIPVIPCTSKTAAEVRSLRKEIGSSDPYIVENGGAIYGSNENSLDEWELVLGRSYKELRGLLDNLSVKIGYPLRALNDLSKKEIEALTGLKPKSISLALQREWSVPFLNPPESDRKKLGEMANKIDLTIYKGNRMSHLLSKGSDKGEAVIKLKKFLKQPDIKIIALGDSQNDLPLLEIADYPVVVPGKEGPNRFLLDGIKNNKFSLAPAPHSEGWSLAIKKIINGI